MIPEERLSSSPVPSAFLGARNGAVDRVLDREHGPRYLQNTDWGLHHQAWEARLSVFGVPMYSATTPEFLAYENTNITELSFSFDQNGRYAIVMVRRERTILYWYDPLVEDYATLDLGKGIITPRLSLDDKRMTQTDASDIILGYVRNNNLYYRQQRDRFLVEKLLKTEINGVLKKIGMNRGLRFQFMVV